MTFSEELTQLLEQELKILNELLVISDEKTNILVKNDVESLESIVPKEEELIKGVITLEKKRMGLLDTWGMNMETPISDIINNIPDGKEELIFLRDKLSDIMNELQRKNDLNNSIMEENLDWLEFNLNLITSTKAPVGYDGEEKRDTNMGNRSIFDTKA